MRITTCFTGFSLYAGALALQARNDGSPQGTNDTATLAPNHFIIQFNSDLDASVTAQDVAENHGGRVLKVFQSEVFHGCAIEAPETNADLLQALDIVDKAWPSRKFFLGPSEPQLLFDGDVVYENYSIHHMTGVDKLHKQGILGKGAKVAVIDTGVNYNHPALGGGFGDGFKVSRGHDFVGDELWPAPGYDKKPDSDPDDKQGHGSHVAGIVAGKGDAMTGVAPEAEIFAYKVFSTIDGTDEETIMEAMLQAFDDGADIITISIGGVDGWTDGPWALIASKLVDLGVLVTVSAGNDGNVGALAASSGSSGTNVLAIASVEPDVITVPGFRVTYNSDDGSSEDTWEPYRSPLSWYPSEVVDWPVVPLSLEPLDDDACAPLPDDTPDFTGKIPLVRRGGCTFFDKQQNLAAFNASYILFYTNDQPFTGPSSIDSSILLAMVTADTGKSIVDAIAAGGNVTVNFDFPETQDRVAIKNFDLPGVASPFTSIGPTNDLYIKSDVGAPGGEILSTYLGDGYASFSGTSMACPYVAGIAALYVSKFGGRSVHGPEWAKKLVMRIIASGEALPWDDGQLSGITYDFFAPVAQVGTGLVNASKVLTYDTDLSLARFALNDTRHFSRYHKVDITNNGDSAIEYTFSQEAFGGLPVMNNNEDDWATPRPAWIEELLTRPVQLVPTISFPRSGFTVQPGQTKTAQFNFDYPKNATAKDLPIYSGKVLIHGSNGDELSIPYLGLAADLKKDNELMYQYPIGLPIITSTREDIPISSKANFTFDLSLEAQDFPRAHARLQLATRELRWDIFETSWKERDWKYPPVVGEDGYIGAVTGWADAGWNNVFDPETADADNLVTTPLLNVPRSVTGRRGVDLWWLGKLANGTTLAPGDYKMRLAVLKPFGNPKAADNWDIVDTPVITIL